MMLNSQLLALAQQGADEEGLTLDAWLDAAVRDRLARAKILREAGIEVDSRKFLPLTTPIEALGFSVRSRNAEEHFGAATLGDLIKIPRWRLPAIANLGQVSVEEITMKLKAIGVTLPAGRD